jgi:hypothetical protein
VFNPRRLESRPIGRVAIPSWIMLTPRVLAGAIRKLPSSQIELVVQASIDELDRRSGDPDFEEDPDNESD